MQKINDLMKTLSKVLKIGLEPISLHEPYLGEKEWEYVKKCLDSGWVSSVGNYVNTFEQKLVDFTGINHCVVVVNGTAALHISLILVGVQPKDEVLIPSLTFVATANAVAYCGAIPHFIDVNEYNLGVDVNKLASYLKDIAYIKNEACINKITGNCIRAIVPVDIFGHAVELEQLHSLAQSYNIKIVEDASEALGSRYKGKHVGYLSDVAVISFNGNKIITSGGGGAIITNNQEVACKAKHITTTAKVNHAWRFEHDCLGYNYRMPNINAALGCAQLEQLPKFIDAKRRLAQMYFDAFKDCGLGYMLKERPTWQSNYWLNAFILDKPDATLLELFTQEAHKNQIFVRGLWEPLDSLPMYKNCPKMDLSKTHELHNRVITFPSSVKLVKRQEASETNPISQRLPV